MIILSGLCGVVIFVTGFLKVPSPLPNKIATYNSLKCTTARSQFPSASKSDTSISGLYDRLCGLGSMEYAAAGSKLPSPRPSKTETTLSLLFPTARSRVPSLLKSRAIPLMGLMPTVKSILGKKLPSPWPSRTETTPVSFGEPQLAIARSRSPSLSKSPALPSMGNACGGVPTLYLGVTTNVLSPLPIMMETLLLSSSAVTRSNF